MEHILLYKNKNNNNGYDNIIILYDYIVEKKSFK